MSNTDVDFGEIEALFTVIEKCVAHSGKYTAIMSEASNRLQQIDADLREAQLEAKAEADAEAARVAEANRPKAIPSSPSSGSDGGEPEVGATVPPNRAPTAPQRRV